MKTPDEIDELKISLSFGHINIENAIDKAFSLGVEEGKKDILLNISKILDDCRIDKSGITWIELYKLKCKLQEGQQ